MTRGPSLAPAARPGRSGVHSRVPVAALACCSGKPPAWGGDGPRRPARTRRMPHVAAAHEITDGRPRWMRELFDGSRSPIFSCSPAYVFLEFLCIVS